VATLTGAANEPLPTPPAPCPSSVTKFAAAGRDEGHVLDAVLVEVGAECAVGCEPTATVGAFANAQAIP
jgi:hypothetical protein